MTARQDLDHLGKPQVVSACDWPGSSPWTSRPGGKRFASSRHGRPRVVPFSGESGTSRVANAAPVVSALPAVPQGPRSAPVNGPESIGDFFPACRRALGSAIARAAAPRWTSAHARTRKCVPEWVAGARRLLGPPFTPGPFAFAEVPLLPPAAVSLSEGLHCTPSPRALLRYRDLRRPPGGLLCDSDTFAITTVRCASSAPGSGPPGSAWEARVSEVRHLSLDGGGL